MEGSVGVRSAHPPSWPQAWQKFSPWSQLYPRSIRCMKPYKSTQQILRVVLICKRMAVRGDQTTSHYSILYWIYQKKYVICACFVLSARRDMASQYMHMFPVRKKEPNKSKIPRITNELQNRHTQRVKKWMTQTIRSLLQLVVIKSSNSLLPTYKKAQYYLKECNRYKSNVLLDWWKWTGSPVTRIFLLHAF